jgi:hypothetical protein
LLPITVTNHSLADPSRITVNENGLLLSTGLPSRIIAQAGKPVQYDPGGSSSVEFHKDPDAADVSETPDGGWIYVSNSEDLPGGVGAIRFDNLGNVVNYQMVAEQSTYNCGGGKPWWNTWLSCEEVLGGQVWETDPYGIQTERMMLLGGPGGRFESAAYYLPNLSNPTFYVSEDLEDGALRRFTPDEAAVELASTLDDFSELLHSNSTGTAKIEFLELIPATGTDNSGTFIWTTNETAARAMPRHSIATPKGSTLHEESCTLPARSKRYFWFSILSKIHGRGQLLHPVHSVDSQTRSSPFLEMTPSMIFSTFVKREVATMVYTAATRPGTIITFSTALHMTLKPLGSVSVSYQGRCLIFHDTKTRFVTNALC